MKILVITAHYSPNIGGVETHLEDLIWALTRRKHKSFVLTYGPLTTKAKRLFFERKKANIIRIPWPPGLFYKLVRKPVLEFIYLMPGLFLFTPIVVLLFNPKVISTHGLAAGFAGMIWGKVFGIRTTIALHNIYQFPKKGTYRSFVKFLLSSVNVVLCLSQQSCREVESLGISKSKVVLFTYWIDLGIFKPVKKRREKFTVLFVGRLVEEKGIKVLINAAKKWNNHIHLNIAGSGPLEGFVQNNLSKGIKFLGKINNKKLAGFYSQASVTIVPSVNEEGFGRVILESLACGTPVIASKLGGIPEAMDDTVGVLIKPHESEIIKAVEFLYENKKQLKYYEKNTRKFAEKYYSEKNVEKIIRAFK